MPTGEQLSDLVWSFVIGLMLIASVVFTIMGARMRNTPQDVVPETDADAGPAPVEPVHEYAGGVAEAHGPVPMVVKLTIAGVLLWTVVYVVLFAQNGYTFS